MSRSHPLRGNIPKLLEDADSEINARACSTMGLDRGSRCSQDRSLLVIWHLIHETILLTLQLYYHLKLTVIRVSLVIVK